MMQRVSVAGLSRDEIRAKYPQVSRVTAWRAAKSGWLVPDYHTRHCETSINPVDPDWIEEIATYAFRIVGHYGTDVRHVVSREDATQEASARLLELAGHADFLYRPFVVKIACRAILGAFRQARHWGAMRVVPLCDAPTADFRAWTRAILMEQ